jgi:hypothetical protein
LARSAGAVKRSEIGQRKVIEAVVVKKNEKKCLKSVESTAFGTEHAILRIRESSA